MSEIESPIYSILASDEDLAELVVLFVDEMPERIERLRKHFADRDWSEFGRTAHQLKGSAGGYGFAPLSVAAAELEEFVKENKPETQIAESLECLVALCRRVTSKPQP